MIRFVRFLVWLAVATMGGAAYAVLAAHRGEHLNSIFILIAAACTYALGYRFYSKWIATRVLLIDPQRATPCEAHEDGRDYVKTNTWIVFGHHFAAISGPGPLVGPVLAAQFGYLPGVLWILIGAVLGGAVQDFVILFCSLRRDGRSLGEMVKEELNPLAGAVALLAILAIMVILLAVLALVVVNALAMSPWGVFTVGATLPIALAMGAALRWVRVGKVLEVSAAGALLLILAVWGGQYVHAHSAFAALFTCEARTLAWILIGYGLLASTLPVWLLLAPRDYLSTFMKLGTILALVLGVAVALPALRMPPLTKFIDGSGLVVAGKLFPFCFITIACGAISGFHTLISSGITPKILTAESAARPVAYGAMCLESLVAIMAMIAACTLDPGVYLAMNVKGAGTTPAAIAMDVVAKVNAQGPLFQVQPAVMSDLAHQVGEASLYGRTGGAATLAVGMANIFTAATHGRGLGLWYHFAIMFEALFILTTLDAGTRVGRYLLQDALGHFWKPFADTRRLSSNILASGIIAGAWGYFLIQGVIDPLGGINSLWPLFGIANQLLAAIALCLATVILLKMSLLSRENGIAGRSPALALITLAPLLWLVSVTFTAGWEKIADSSPRIGFFAAAHDLDAKAVALEEAVNSSLGAAEQPRHLAALRALRVNRAQHFNCLLDAWVAGIFLTLVALIILITARECALLWSRRKAPRLRETPPIFLSLPAAQSSPQPAHLFGFLALVFTLVRELSGQADVDREVRVSNCTCAKPTLTGGRQNAYLTVARRRFNGIRNCC